VGTGVAVGAYESWGVIGSDDSPELYKWTIKIQDASALYQLDAI
jgi:hypothetical protein